MSTNLALETARSIKAFPDQQGCIGSQTEGGIIEINGAPHWLRHESWRYNGHEWGRENGGFALSDTTEVGYHLLPLKAEQTAKVVEAALEQLRQGDLPPDMTTGVEVEATLYDRNGNLLRKHDGEQIKIAEDQHPELLSFIVESATGKANGSYLRNPTDLAQGIAATVLTSYQVADLRNGRLVLSSVPEGGRYEQANITPHPYLQLAAPRVLEFTLENWKQIPKEVLDLYRLFVDNPQEYFRQTGILNWPVQALHVHSGVPQIEGAADTRIAHAFGQMRLTEFSKILSFMLYNSRHLYGVDTGLKDVRSVIRRLLATTHDSSIPDNAEELVKKTAQALQQGNIHSPSRYPASGQHDRVRFRMESSYKTVESIDGSMTPDLRTLLAWVYSSQIMNVIALDALAQTRGDESLVIPYLKSRFGDLFQTIPSLGTNSSYAQDKVFNTYGYQGKIGEYSYADLVNHMIKIMHVYAQKYPAIKHQTDVVAHVLNRQLAATNPQTDLASYLGTESGNYNPNGLNDGLITDYKNRPVAEVLEIQSKATRAQAERLSEVRDTADIVDFIGL